MPKTTEIIMYAGLGKLPHYNSDLDQGNEPAQVKEMRGMIARSSAIIISTPEYARGIPGSLKNALDWLVSTTLLENKPVGVVLCSSSEGNHAQDALVEVLQAMNAKVVTSAVISISGVQQKLTDQSIASELKNFADGFLSNALPKS